MGLLILQIRTRIVLIQASLNIRHFRYLTRKYCQIKFWGRAPNRIYGLISNSSGITNVIFDLLANFTTGLWLVLLLIRKELHISMKEDNVLMPNLNSMLRLDTWYGRFTAYFVTFRSHAYGISFECQVCSRISKLKTNINVFKLASCVFFDFVMNTFNDYSLSNTLFLTKIHLPWPLYLT